MASAQQQVTTEINFAADMAAFFVLSKNFTCIISNMVSLSPVQIVVGHGESKRVAVPVYDYAVLIHHVERQGFDHVAGVMKKDSDVQDVYRDFIEYELQEGRPKPPVQDVDSLPLAIKLFAQAVAKQPVDLRDRELIRNFIFAYLNQCKIEIAKVQLCKEGLCEEKESCEKGLCKNKSFDPTDIVVHGESLLYVASKFGLDDCVAELMTMGFDCNQEQEYGLGESNKRTPLYIASTYGYAEVVRVLLSNPKHEQHANPNYAPSAPYLRRATPAHSAIEQRQQNLKQSKEIEAKMYLDIIDNLAAGGADFSAVDLKEGTTALYYAVYNADLEAVQIMLRSSTVRVDILQDVKFKKNKETGMAVINEATKRAELEPTGHTGKSALFVAVFMYFSAKAKSDHVRADRYKNIIKALVTKGADVNLTQGGREGHSLTGKTPLGYAREKAECGQEIVDILSPQVATLLISRGR